MSRNKLLAATLMLALIALSTVGRWTASASQEAPEAITANMGTGFTYQGRLLSGGSPANGSFNMTFGLFDVASGGTALATVGPNSVSVANGLFNVVLDFGQNFDGQARWLEIVVSGTPLSPRQPLTPSPYALALPGLWTQQNGTTGASAANLIGGYHGNIIEIAASPAPSAVGATISGGGGSGIRVQTIKAAGDYSTIGGGEGNTVECEDSTIGGGSTNVVGQRNAVIAGGVLNRILIGTGVDCSTAGDGTIGGGFSNFASAPYATVAGGRSNTAQGNNSVVGGGFGNKASGDNSTVSGGSDNTASGVNATVPGGTKAAATHYGEMAYAGGQFTAAGDAQSSLYVLRGTSTDASLKELSLDDAATPAEFITIASGRTVVFEIQVGARSQTGTSAGYLIEGVIENVGGTTAFVGTPTVTVLGEDNTAMDATVVADNANDRLAVFVTGLAGVPIRWVATVRTTEVSFP